MARYHHIHKERGWHHKLVINFSAGVTSLIVVAIFVLVKFTEGAWLVVVIFVIGVPLLIRLNRQYQMEAEVLEKIGGREGPATPTAPTYSRRTVYVFVDDFDLATLAGLRYARSLRPTSIRAVHFVLDSTQAAKLRQDWLRANTGVALDLVDCPDRRLAKAAAEMVHAEALLPGVGVTAVLPRRSFAPLLGRLLHDRTADKIAAVVSQIPHAVATIVPFDVRSRVESLIAKDRERTAAVTVTATAEPVDEVAQPEVSGTRERVKATVEASEEPPSVGKYNRPAPSVGATPIGQLPKRGRATVEGRVHSVEIMPVERNTVLACEIIDSTGQLTAMFYGRSYIPGLDPGAKVRLTGPVGSRGRAVVMINPAYELLAPGKADPPPS
jgi:hypothetical protein